MSGTTDDKYKKYVFPSVSAYYKEPLTMVRGQGKFLWDDQGRQYLDFFGGILTISVGHCHPEVTRRVTEQVGTLVHTSTIYHLQPQADLAERLAQLTPGNLQKTFFTNSGTEANETAVLLAKLYTDRQEIVALRHGYSGRSMLAISLTGHASWRSGGTHILGIKHAHNPYCYRCAMGLTYPGCELRCATDLEELIRTETSGQVAAFIAEPIQGVGGFVTPPKEYFQIAIPIVRKYGGVFICDEVQTGWGRTGGKMFGIEHYGVEPDIMTFAKGLANGAPIGATIARPEIADSWKGSTISTFGGNPVTMTAALATLDVIEKEDIPHNAEVVGAHLRQGLLALQEKYPCIGDVRGMGLMIGVELVHAHKQPAADLVPRVFEKTRELGLLIGRGGLYGNVIRITPPMNITKADADVALAALDRAFASLPKEEVQ